MKVLNPQVAAKYQLIGLRPGKYAFKNFGEIDLCSLTVARADDLFKKGFPHFRLRQPGNQADPAAPADLSAKPLNVIKPAEKPDVNPVALRSNKQYVNKLLTMNFSDLTHQEKLLFFNDERYFLIKKSMLLEIAAADREMKSLHAKAKATAKSDGSKDAIEKVMKRIAELEDLKIKYWEQIDTWKDPIGQDPEQLKATAAKEALERDKLIKAHGNYIYRAELALPNMPKSKPAEKKRYQEKLAEVERRKQELVKLGAPYDRKARK